MMYDLVIDIGNSSCKMALVRDLVLGEVVRCTCGMIMEGAKVLIGNHQLRIIAISSVAGKDDIPISELRKICTKLILLDCETPTPISICYDTPKTLGMDRLASAVGAYMLFPGKDCVIFDFGTAITIDKVNNKGEFVGGNISLGMATRFNAINHYTSQLPLVSKNGGVGGFGKSTTDAIRNGVILGIMFEVEGYISKYPNHLMVFTGGDAIYFAERMKSPIFAVCNLVLIGLSHIAVYNATK